MGVLTALAEAGLSVPEDISVVGLRQHQFRRTWPDLADQRGSARSPTRWRCHQTVLIQKYAVFSGRARRSGGTRPLSIVGFPPALAVGVRRLHDTDNSGW